MGASHLKTAIQVATHLGPAWMAFRAKYAWKKRMGAFKRSAPSASWSDITAVPLRSLSWPAAPRTIGTASIDEASDILNGRFRLFSFHSVSLGAAPDWHRNPLTGEKAPSRCHWSEISDFGNGDIKAIWELSRFHWAFVLGRAYAKTGSLRYVDRFWSLVEAWMDSNPPNTGPNWMCGQEAALRLFATVFAVRSMAAAASTTRERLVAVSKLVVATGSRISANLDYALSQSNNHGISECVGLLTAALVVDDAAIATGWKEKALRGLEQQVSELVYADGGFAQHSAVYHRVLLHDLYSAIAIMRAAGEPVPDWLTAGTRRALDFCVALLDRRSGTLPLYGANDGANILPVADGQFLDFRPTIQAGYALLRNGRALDPGQWDEMADWLAGEKWREGPAVSVKVPELAPGIHHFPDAGCLLWRSGESQLFMRCPTRFRHRPSHADLTHVDVSWRGSRITHDAGTFSYNASGQFADALKSAAVHNALTIDGREPMRKVGRFLYLPWPKGRVNWDAAAERFSGSHDGWSSIGVRHVRTIQSPQPSRFSVVDEVFGSASHKVRLQWLLADIAFHLHRDHLVLYTPDGNFEIGWQVPAATVSAERADPKSNRGWWAPHYLHAAPALSLVLELEFTGQLTIETTFGPARE